MDDTIVATHWWRNTWGATKEASVVGRLSSCCLGIIISWYINFSYFIFVLLFCCFCVSENWPTKAQVQVTGGICYYITMIIICLFSVASLFQFFLLWGKTDQKRRWSRWSGRGCVGGTPRHSGVAPGEKGRLCRIERNWRRYERQFKLQSSDAKYWCHTL